MRSVFSILQAYFHVIEVRLIRQASYYNCRYKTRSSSCGWCLLGGMLGEFIITNHNLIDNVCLLPRMFSKDDRADFINKISAHLPSGKSAQVCQTPTVP